VLRVLPVKMLEIVGCATPTRRASSAPDMPKASSLSLIRVTKRHEWDTYRNAYSEALSKFLLTPINRFIDCGHGYQHIPTRRASADRGLAGSQSALARALGVSQPTVWHWLNQTKRLPAEHVLRAEQLYGVSRHDLRPDIHPVERLLAPQGLCQRERCGMSNQKSRVFEALKMIEPIDAQSAAESRQGPPSPCLRCGHTGGFQLPDHEELQKLLRTAVGLAFRIESALRASLSSAERLSEQPAAAALNRHRSFLQSLVAALADPDADAR